ncbi:acyl carrier protein [Blastomonas sp.]|uniref:acyl carrier protein n=1 Tax=Blastomonas sp. TaxID=1909299 RepID=UPI00260F4AD0|nr:acyl carrier protein [Blastomonas sp.]MDM7955457.1 acyl carrier protein [Blastomonas sp.]
MLATLGARPSTASGSAGDGSFAPPLEKIHVSENDPKTVVARHIDPLHILLMADTLDLDPEWGAIDLIEELEATFGFKIQDEEAERCCTVGDVYDLICAHTAEWDDQEGLCGSSMVFYRLRRALRPDDKRSITPSTPLALLAPSPSKLMDGLSKRTGLRLPLHTLTGLGAIGAVLLLAGIVLTVVASFNAHWGFAGASACVAMIALILVWRDPSRFPKGIQTLGDLVNRAVPLNSKLLKELGGRPADRWSILTSLSAEHGKLEPAGISPETYLHKKSLDEARAA